MREGAGHQGTLELLIRATVGFPGDSDGEKSTCNAGDPGCPILGQEDSLEKEMAT